MTVKKQTDEKPLEYLTFDYNGTTYTMEFNRRSVEVLEKNFGMSVSKALNGDINMSDLPNVFRCSLLMHHPRMKQQTVDMLYDQMGNKTDLMSALLELVAVAANSLFEEPEEGKAISWTRH